MIGKLSLASSPIKKVTSLFKSGLYQMRKSNRYNREFFECRVLNVLIESNAQALRAFIHPLCKIYFSYNFFNVDIVTKD